MSGRPERLAEHYAHLAAEYVNAESNRTSLITVTRALVSDDLSRVTVLVTALPEERERAAVDFLNRGADDFRSSVAKRTRVGKLPRFTFAIDAGEKNRQRLDSISSL